MFFATNLLAADLVVFQPVVSGIAIPETTQNPPTSNQWPGWCGVRVQQQKNIFKKLNLKSYYALDDGQRFAGIFEFDNTKISWRNNVLESIFIDLEHAQSIGPLSIGGSDTKLKDTVLLVNNDRLDGFIESIDGTTGVALQVTTPGTPINEKLTKQLTHIPIERIVEICLSTKIKQPTGWRFWMSDGSVIDVDSWSDDKNKCHLKGPHINPEMQASTIFWNEVLSIAPNPNSISALANCSWKAITNPDSFVPRLSPPTIKTEVRPASFDAIPMDLHGPGGFKFTTNQTKGTLSALLSLPPQLEKKINCQITIECEGKILWQNKVTPNFKPTQIKIPVDSCEIIVRLDESKHGAFGCAIRMNEAILISDSCGTPPQSNPPPPIAPVKSDL